MINEYEEELIKKLFKNEATEDICVIKTLRDRKWAFAFKLQTVNETSTSERVTEENFKKAFDVRSDFLIESVILCFYRRVFLKEKENQIRSYCLKKYALDNNLIDPEYKIDLNPVNQEVTSETCTSYVKEFKDVDNESFANISNEYINERNKYCALKKVSEFGLSKKILLLAVLEDLDLSDEQKENEKKKLELSKVEPMIRKFSKV